MRVEPVAGRAAAAVKWLWCVGAAPSDTDGSGAGPAAAGAGGGPSLDAPPPEAAAAFMRALRRCEEGEGTTTRVAAAGVA